MGQQISKGIELAKSKGGSHFAITEISSKKGGAAQQTEEELNKILMHILKELPNLNRITVTSCNLTLLPDEELGKVINLVTLSLEENMLTQLNEGFRNLFNLKELYLSKNHFTRLPKELGYLASLELLSLNHNYLGGAAPPRSASPTSGVTMSPSKDKGSNKLDTWRKSWRNRKGKKSKAGDVMATDDFYRTGSEPVMSSSLGSEEKGKEKDKDKGKKWTLRRSPRYSDDIKDLGTSKSHEGMLTSSPPQVRTRSVPDGPGKGGSPELMSSPSLPPFAPSAPAKLTLRERLAAGKTGSLSTAPIDPERLSSSTSASHTTASSGGDSASAARVQRSLTVSDPIFPAGNYSPREGSFDTLSDNDSFTASMDDISLDGDGMESARASGLFPSMDEDNSYVGPIELPSLTYLNFSDNSLAQIPRELNLASCTRLKKVLLGSNRLTSLPPTFFGLTSLTSLGLEENNITELPEELVNKIGNLVEVSELLLRRNRISKLPDSWNFLENLKNLDLSSNRLTELPPSIGGLKNLHTLFIQHNQITSLPDEFGKLNNLNKLLMNDNKLEYLPLTFGGLTSLTELSLAENRLLELPPSFGALKSLRKLSAESNCLRALPAEFRHLSKLQMASFKSNQFREIPTSFLFLKLLRIDMADNPIQDEIANECIRKHGCLALIRTAQKILTDEKAPPEPPPAHEWKLAFELLLDQMDIPIEKKRSMQALPDDKRWVLLLQSRGTGLLDLNKRDSMNKAYRQEEDPNHLAEVLKGQPTVDEMTTLRVSLTSKPVGWIAQWIEAGGLVNFAKLLSCTYTLTGAVAEQLRENLLSCYKALWRVRLKDMRERLRQQDVVEAIALHMFCANLRVKKIAIEILISLCQTRNDHRSVLSAFTSMQKALGDKRRFMTLFQSLTEESATFQVVVLPLRIRALTLINALINGTEDLEERFALRNEFLAMNMASALKNLREAGLEELTVQVDLFEEAMSDDYESMLDRFGAETLLKKLDKYKLELGLGQNYLMVMTSSLSQTSLDFLPFDPAKTTVADIIRKITENHPVKNAADWGLHLHSTGACLDEAKSLAFYKLRGPVICQFKMKMWEIPVRFRLNRNKVKQYTLQFDPNDTCSDAIINLIQNLPKIKAGTFGKQKDNRQIKFATASPKKDQTSTSDLENVTAESYEDYGLYLPSTSSVVTTLQSSKSTIISPFAPKQASSPSVGPAGVWLEATKSLAFYELNHRKEVVELRLKPKLVKIKFLDNTFQQIAFDQYMLVQEMVEEIGTKLGLDQAKALDYGLLLEFPSDEEEAQNNGGDIESYLKSSMSSPVHLPSSTSAPVNPASGVGAGLASSASGSAGSSSSLPLTSSVSHNVAATTSAVGGEPAGSSISGRAKPPRPPRPADIKPAPRPAGLVLPSIFSSVPKPPPAPRPPNDMGPIVDGVWMSPEAELHSYDIKHLGVRFLLRPQKVTVATPEGEKHVEVDPTLPVEQITRTICEALGIKPDQLAAGGDTQRGFSLTVQSEDEETALNPKRALRTQSKNWRKSVFVIKTVNKGDGIVKDDINDDDDDKDGEEPCSVVYSESSPGEIEAASFPRLVEHLTSPSSYDKSFIDAFFMTYRTFAPPEQLLQQLIARYTTPTALMHAKDHNLVKMRVFDILRIWLETKFTDFADAALKQELNEFVGTTMKNDASFDAREACVTRLTQCIQRGEGSKRMTLIPLTKGKAAGKAKVPKALCENPSLFDMDEEEVARQLCLMVWKSFAKIEADEFFEQAWSKEKTQHRCPNVMAMIANFNEISAAVATMILSQERVRDRRNLMWRLVNIAQALLKYNNFHTLMAFLSAFNNSAVLRLKWTRERLPAPTKKFLVDAEALMSMEGSFKEYRRVLSTALPPCIPYIGVVLADLTFIEDGNPNETGPSGKLINFYKRRLMYKNISALLHLQSMPYSFNRVPEAAKLFREGDKLNDSQLYSLSLEREPRNAKKSSIL
ncbi:RasGEF domain containing protein [Acanthamoeba castellanii str. Neff]|uniref:RasGEF domain containing protein n=1 Tax=Acanthamoeba castellanii (strain ATCC 30010 / Neff) TaxID=1257118 RepID=L8HMK7_ACACF|nr:RasGEF domain containing protein [Acanthamoeba castellanii str. Neff]ELR25601.1 RasGEF domain containing protein [Acanthamoeba castellanii str. Neff]